MATSRPLKSVAPKHARTRTWMDGDAFLALSVAASGSDHFCCRENMFMGRVSVHQVE